MKAFLELCRECKFSTVPEGDRCSNPKINAKDLWALAAVTRIAGERDE